MTTRQGTGRLALLAVPWAGLPLLAALFVHGADASGVLLVYAVAIAALWTGQCSGLSWKRPERVQGLLAEGEKVMAVLPVRHPRSSVGRRLLHGCFVVLTERQVLVFAYNRLLDVPTDLMWEVDRHEDAVVLRDGRTLVLSTPGTPTELALPRRHRPTTTPRPAALLRKPPPAPQPPPSRPGRGRGPY
ncbi:hypothetical protein [Streptomyces sp. AC512_CC834]|uniref:hypothetical protein n=1 Tax=Streptomyces sp. AC512_CC834 TaxID=2823691 RepID=UPI001C276B70|nr:hypothetical protein [Streptomyces sp. AC512_CC834]